MRVVVSPHYSSLHDWLLQVPQLFSTNQGQLLYDGRNQIRLFAVDGQQLVVKRYKRHDAIKILVYSFFRKNKARRAYENAQELTRRGFVTPCPIAFLECATAGFITQVYYVCAYTDAQPIRPRLIEQDPFDRPLASQYARFVVALHEAGVLHRDLNPTNVLVDSQGRFQLIDINRMRFFGGPVPKDLSMENLTLFYWLTPAYRFILGEYAAQRGWTEADIQEAIRVKQRHDRRWVRRKKITHPFRK